jgi:hypothetical protein
MDVLVRCLAACLRISVVHANAIGQVMPDLLGCRRGFVTTVLSFPGHAMCLVVWHFSYFSHDGEIPKKGGDYDMREARDMRS